MNNFLKLIQTEDIKVYFTSDTHLGHNKPFVVEARGYKTIADHDTALIDKINERVRANDILFHLGDFCLNTDESKLNEFLSRIQCQYIYLLWGNHNNPLWKVYRREVNAYANQNETGPPSVVKGDIEVYPFRYKNIVFIGNYAEISVDGKVFILSHYPNYVFNHMKEGAMHLCGHSHYSLELSQADNLTSKILDVGWDGHAKPMSLTDILSIMQKKNVAVVDHHKTTDIIN